MTRRTLIAGVMFALTLSGLGASSALQTRAEVSIENLSFNPARVTIRKGQSVRWTNNDDRDHKVVARDGGFASPNLKPKDTFDHTFNAVGTFDYVCEYRPRMRGTIVVE